MKIKQNKFIIFTFLILFVLIGYSFYQYFVEHFSYIQFYYEVKDVCYEKGNMDHKVCRHFRDKEDVKKFLIRDEPKKRYQEIDAITLTCEIVENTKFSLLQLFSPLLILIAFIGTVHSDFTSGMFKYKLQRMTYKDYLKTLSKVILKVSLLIPVTLLLVFIFSIFITRFNFHVLDEVKGRSVYESFKYSHFILYGGILCIIQFLLNILYCNIGLYVCKKNKNKIVAIVMGFVYYLLVYLFVYLIVYVVFINKILGIKELTDYFNISGYWFFDIQESAFYYILISFILALLSSLFIIKVYKNKEEVIVAHESQMS